MVETNNYSQIGVINRLSSGRDLVDKEMDDLIPRMNEIPLEGARWFRRVTAETLKHKESTIGNALEQPVIQEDTDDVRYSTPAPGFPIEFTAQILRLGVRVTRTLTINQRIKKVNQLMGGLMDAGRRNLEYAFASPFNNAFTSLTGADGLALVDTGHPNENIMTGTWDNLDTPADLTPAAFSTGRVNMSKRTNETGEIMPMKPSVCMVTPDNEEALWMVLNSKFVADSSLLGESWNKNAVKPFVYNYLTDPDAWFLIDDAEIQTKGGLVYFEKEAPTIRPNPSPKIDIKFDEYLRMAYAVGFTTWKAIQGNAGN